jgi:hypothetical protein
MHNEKQNPEGLILLFLCTSDSWHFGGWRHPPKENWYNTDYTFEIAQSNWAKRLLYWHYTKNIQANL